MTGDTPDQGEDRVVAGRYRLLRKLGAGGMGRVWLAYDEELACQVSIKEIAMSDTAMADGEPAARIARARSEARYAARLRGHPHVATVHDVVVHDGLPWIVMEFVPEAVDLQALIRRAGPLTPAETARVGLAVLDALTAGHRIGILHRDVKPANILLAPDASGAPYGRVLLTDYGIALQPQSGEPRLTATAGVLGTPGYLAPERARGEPPTPAADLFSLGATLYAAVEGRGPFDRADEYGTLTALLTEDPTPPVRAGAELGAVLHGLLLKDPVRRAAPEVVARGLEAARRTAAAGFGPPVAGGPEPGGPPAPATPSTPPHGTSEPSPYASLPLPGGSGPAPAPGPYGTWNPYATPAPEPAPAPRRIKPSAAVVAMVAAVVLVLGGAAWAVVALLGDDDTKHPAAKGTSSPSGSATATPTGPVYPYGESVGLLAPLKAGDCVSVVWPGAPLAAPPNLGVVDCGEDDPDGQVIAVERSADAEAARTEGPGRCSGQTDALVKSLPEAASYAVVPTKEGFDAAEGATACLVVGQKAALGGEIGTFRDEGADLPVSTWAMGDCLLYKEVDDDTVITPLTDCAEPHTDQVVGFVKMPQTTQFKDVEKKMHKLCANRYESAWAPGADLAMFGWRPWESQWEDGMRTLVCTVGRPDLKPTTGRVSGPVDSAGLSGTPGGQGVPGVSGGHGVSGTSGGHGLSGRPGIEAVADR
ncbi:protein kinase [Streptomyces ficellus]|uniref:non-specific serine/threonine protein kinase n=1 Tax=Streptomyces ficellus TaxID=1977088 RepID=A0ABT7Z9N5_9ACTN|nr:serine/threonine-protein kinase [Streptomyces ficellus]MDN3296155.1 protein kinase [Streptomyces ficellus]